VPDDEALAMFDHDADHVVGGDPEALKALIQSLQKEVYAADHLVDLSTSFSAVANTNRLRILYALSQTNELCVGDLAHILKISHPAISNHLKKLRQASLVDFRREAQKVYYYVPEDNRFFRILTQLFEKPQE